MQIALSMAVPTLAGAAGILVNNSRLTDLRLYMDGGFNDMDRWFEDNSGDWYPRLDPMQRLSVESISDNLRAARPGTS